MSYTQFKITETRKPGGWYEIGVRNLQSELLCVITRPCSGAKWFLHPMGSYEKFSYKTKNQALEKAKTFGT